MEDLDDLLGAWSDGVPEPYYGAQGDVFSADPPLPPVSPLDLSLSSSTSSASASFFALSGGNDGTTSSPLTPPSSPPPSAAESAAAPSATLHAQQMWDAAQSVLVAALRDAGDVTPPDPFTIDALVADATDAATGLRHGIWAIVAPSHAVRVSDVTSVTAAGWAALHHACGLPAPSDAAASTPDDEWRARLAATAQRRATFRATTRVDNPSMTYLALDAFALQLRAATDAAPTKKRAREERNKKDREARKKRRLEQEEKEKEAAVERAREKERSKAREKKMERERLAMRRRREQQPPLPGLTKLDRPPPVIPRCLMLPIFSVAPAAQPPALHPSRLAAVGETLDSLPS